MPPVPNPFGDDLTIGPLIGSGRRSYVYAGKWRGEPVVLKVYTSASICKYRRRYGVSIAQFEHDRNAAFYEVPRLRRFAPRPVAWKSAGKGADECREFFVQERVDGIELHELLGETGRLPLDVLCAIEDVVETATAHGLYDIDMSPTNFLMQHDVNGWRPVLFDFNLMPQHLHAPNPLVARNAILPQSAFRLPDATALPG